MQKKWVLAVTVASFLCATSSAYADGSTALTDLSAGASEALAASGTVVAGSALVAGSAVVIGVTTLGASTVIVLKGASDAGATSIQVSGQLARDLGVAAGGVVRVVSCSTGQLLIASGRILAFIPNALGRSLVHSSHVAAR